MSKIPNRAISSGSEDQGGRGLPIAPALAVSQNNVSVSTAQDIAINNETTLIRIFSKDSALFVRFKSANQSSAATNAAFDEYVPAGAMVDMGVPFEVAGSIPTHISVFAEAATATIIIQK